MKFITPSYEVLPIPDGDSGSEVLKHIERIGRVCYKSEDKITSESAIRFIANLRERKHWAMLEHFIFVMSVPKSIYLDIVDAYQITDTEDYELHNHLKYIDATEWRESPSNDFRYIVSGSATAFNYLWESTSLRKHTGVYAHGILQLCYFLAIEYPDLMKNPYNDQLICPEGVRFLTRKEIESLPVGLRLIHDSMSTKFICSRGTCYDDKTKVLTDEGWRYFNELDDTYLLCTMNDNDEIEYLPADKFIKERFRGMMHHWHSTQIDLMVTPNHNMWLYDYDKRSKESKTWKFIKSGEANNGRYKFNKSAKRINKIVKDMVFIPGSETQYGSGFHYFNPLYLSSNEFYELLGLWVTDGSLYYGKRGSGNRVIISQIKEEVRKRIEELLKLLNINFSENKRGFDIYNQPLFWYLSDNFIHQDNHHKTYYLSIPREIIKQMSADNIDAFLKGVCEGDGTPHTSGSKGSYQVYTASYSFAEDIVELCLLSGKCANIYRVKPRERIFPNGRKVMCKEQYVVSIINNTTTHLWYNNKSEKTYKREEFYDGFVYCVELPKYHRLYVMREGKACWCGNSHDLVRHRPASWAMESTRWINYVKKGGLNFAIPVWFDEEDHEWLLNEEFIDGAIPLIDTNYPIDTPLNKDAEKFMIQCRHVERLYNDFISTHKYRPEQAREILPHTLKTELTMTARLGEWRHFFKMRAANDVAPQMKEIVVPLFHQMLKEKPEIFGDMKWVVDWEVKNNG